MGVVGIGLIVASVVWVLVRPPSWMPEPLQILLRWRGTGPPAIVAKDEAETEADDADPGPRIMVSDHELEPGPRLRARPTDNRTTRDDESAKLEFLGWRSLLSVMFFGLAIYE
ncbi:cytochrome b-type NAD(P)H oxidoreductase [Fusarium acutatum]|uniref:Cytochrome b-type NAD(P)H oxidoreductase n=1 Tax=Fusarium acutatum TaxID=78861 RepID=A0A8H4NC97_9HYPO|nr:cytochrome b-type NAD(P)H oxidoreductase [Fusarium acutatum]